MELCFPLKVSFNVQGRDDSSNRIIQTPGLAFVKDEIRFDDDPVLPEPEEQPPPARPLPIGTPALSFPPNIALVSLCPDPRLVPVRYEELLKRLLAAAGPLHCGYSGCQASVGLVTPGELERHIARHAKVRKAFECRACGKGLLTADGHPCPKEAILVPVLAVGDSVHP